MKYMKITLTLLTAFSIGCLLATQVTAQSSSVIRGNCGNCDNAVTDTTKPVYDSVEKMKQRVGWMVGDAKTPVL